MRLIVADHHEQPRWALRMLLEEQQGYDLVGEAVNAQNLLALTEKTNPGVVLVDRELPGMRVEDLIAKLKAIEPRPIVIVMGEIEFRRMLIKAGADSLVSKEDDPGRLLEELHKFQEQIRIQEDANTIHNQD